MNFLLYLNHMQIQILGSGEFHPQSLEVLINYYTIVSLLRGYLARKSLRNHQFLKMKKYSLLYLVSLLRGS